VLAIGADGTGRRALGRGGRPAFSRDGSKLAFTLGGDVWTMNADGSGRRLLAAGGDDAAWSPDGRRLVFVRGGDLWTVTADATGEARLTSGPADDRQPAWSPDGARVAFTSNRDRVYALYVMRADGSGARLLDPPLARAWTGARCTREGTGGADRLAGTSGRDVLCGLAGDDVLLARDGVRDVVDGGPGRDRAVVDRLDVVHSVESVSRR
jgi:Tol biopolymer transport system component